MSVGIIRIMYYRKNLNVSLQLVYLTIRMSINYCASVCTGRYNAHNVEMH